MDPQTQECPSVLVVDDDPEFATAVTEHLAAMGFRASRVATRRAGLAALQEERPRVVLLDLLLPDGSGAEILGEIRRREMQTLCIVVTISWMHMRLLSEMPMFQPDHSFLKPVDPREIAKWLQAHFNNRAGVRMPE